MNNRLIVIGAGGHGKVVADNALKNGYFNINFVDDHATGTCMGFPIIGTSAEIDHLNDGKTDFVIGVGNNAIRNQIAEKYDVNWVTLIHPSAQIAVNVSIGKGTVVMAGAVINASATVGEHCIINTGAIVEHDNAIGDYVHISPRAALGGTVRVGDLTHIGIGAVVKNNIAVCDHCVIGAGAVVVKEIKDSGTYVGVPSREIG
jgi:sugar O-acyltransferase (sialic acid O-acetyltransferase NeuD family)